MLTARPRPRRRSGWAAVSAATVALVVGCSDQAPVAESPVPVPPPSTATDAWTRVTFEDDFSGSSLDRAKWGYELGTYGDGNGELACLTDDPGNLSVVEGKLRIVAQRETPRFTCGSSDSRFPRGRQYTSAMLQTRDTFSQTYGGFELLGATMPKLPATGTVPAFWMRPVAGGFGEIDIVEVPGATGGTAARTVHAAAHHDYEGLQPKVTHDQVLPAGDGDVTTPHDYAVEWEPTEIRWYLDGVNYLTLAQTGSPVAPRSSPTARRVEVGWFAEAFRDRAFFLRLNLAVGGTWAGTPPRSSTFPAVFSVDAVRVYARGSS